MATVVRWNESGMPAAVASLGAPVRVVPMVVGITPIPESISLEHGSPDVIYDEPVTVVAVVYAGGGWFLLDSGLDVERTNNIDDDGLNGSSGMIGATLSSPDPLIDEVAAAGLRWEDLLGCAVSHLHHDHTGGLGHVAGRAPLLLQRNEWVWGTATEHAPVACFRDHYVRDDLDVVLLDGDTEIAPGLTALDTKGHTPGHQSFRVAWAGRDVVFTFDAADFAENVSRPIPCGMTCVRGMEEDSRDAIHRLHDLQHAGADVWPSHDPQFDYDPRRLA